MIFCLSKFFVFCVKCTILLIVDRIIRLISRLPFRTVLTADHSLRQIISVCIFSEFKPLVLNDSCPWCFSVCVINCRISLEIRLVQKFCLKTYRTIFQISHRITKVCIDRSCINYFICKYIILCFFLKIIFSETYFYTIQHICNHLCISAYRNPLIKCIKVVVVKSQSYRKTLDDKCRKILAVTSPLFLCVTFDQFLKDITSYKRNCLLFQILRFCNTCFFLLLFNLCRCLFRCHNPPHFIKCVHIERK